MLAETPVTQRSPYYSAVSSSLMNPLPDYSNYSPFCHTHFLILRINTSLICLGQTLYQAAPLETNISLLQHFSAPLHIIVHRLTKAINYLCQSHALSTANTRGIGDNDASYSIINFVYDQIVVYLRLIP